MEIEEKNIEKKLWRLHSEVGMFTQQRTLDAINETIRGLKKSEEILLTIIKDPEAFNTLKNELENLKYLTGILAFGATNLALLIDYIENGADSQIYTGKSKK